MPLIEKTTFKRSDYEYESPDGDKYSIVLIETNDRKYVEFTLLPEKEGEPTNPPVRWDCDMVLDVADILRKVTSSAAPTGPVVVRGSGFAGLNAPNVIDYRNIDSTRIQHGVDQSLQRMDHNVPPTESLSQVAEHLAYHQNATGIDVRHQPRVDDTPLDMSLTNTGEGMPKWKEDAISRMTGQVVNRERMVEQRVRRRVDPHELMG